MTTVATAEVTPVNHGGANNAIELVGLTKSYGRKLAVDHLSLNIPSGTVFGLVGPNGAGKSTTIKMLMGMLSITSGTARVLGHDVASEPSAARRRIGYVPEVNTMYRWMRIDELIGFVKPFYETWDDALCSRMLGSFQLEARKKVKHLSKGMLGKLALVVALAHSPDLLVLDEPMSGIDPVTRDEFLDELALTLRERQCTALLSSHTLADVQRLAGEVGILFEGRLLDHCGIAGLLSSTKRVHAVLRDGCVPRKVPDGTIWQSLKERDWYLTIREFSDQALQELRSDNLVEVLDVQDLNLEDVFKDLIKGRRQP
ncbi:MAG: ABC transporter ATP-binding protein [Isosphaeraceae bacterium]